MKLVIFVMSSLSLDAHTSSLMMSDSDSEDEEIIFDDDLNRKPIMNGTNVNKRNGIAKANARA